MPTGAELGDVMLQSLAQVFSLLKTLFFQLQLVGNNETFVNSSRGAYQSFWEIWYSAGATVYWTAHMLTAKWGYIDIININSTLEDTFADVVEIAAKNATWMIGDIEGNNATTFFLRVMVNALSNQSNHVFVANYWNATAEMIRLVSDALKYFPGYFPP